MCLLVFGGQRLKCQKQALVSRLETSGRIKLALSALRAEHLEGLYDSTLIFQDLVDRFMKYFPWTRMIPSEISWTWDILNILHPKDLSTRAK